MLAVVGAVAAALALTRGSDPVTVARYDYRFTLPAGWTEAGGDPDVREVRIVPEDAGGPEAVLVQETRLGYDSGTAPARGPGEIGDLIAAQDAAEYSGFDPAARYAGRGVVHYRQRPGDGSTIEWYVVFEGRVQVSVGCRATPAAVVEVERACREVVSTLQVQP